MLDLSNSVILPREDYIELSETAWNQTTTLGERVGGTVQTIIVCASLAGAVIAATWGWAKQMKELEDKKLENQLTLLDEKRRMTYPTSKD